MYLRDISVEQFLHIAAFLKGNLSGKLDILHHNEYPGADHLEQEGDPLYVDRK